MTQPPPPPLPCSPIICRAELHSETQPFLLSAPPSPRSFSAREDLPHPLRPPCCCTPYSLSLEYSSCLAQPVNNCFSFKTRFESCLIHKAFFQPLQAEFCTSSSVILRSLVRASMIMFTLLFNCLHGCSPNQTEYLPKALFVLVSPMPGTQEASNKCS